MFSARTEHFVAGLVFLVVYLYGKRGRPEGRVLQHPLSLLVVIPVLYLGTAISDWDISLLGIGAHRNPLFHSSVPYFVAFYLWRRLGLEQVVAGVGGDRLMVAVPVSFALGLASHMVLDIVQYGDVRWIPGDALGKLWLAGHAVVLLLAAWYTHPRLPVAALTK